MRELRLYVIDGDEPAGRWRIVDRTSLEVADGEVWVTIEGLPDDHWLGAGAALMLTPWMPPVAWTHCLRHAVVSLPT